MVRANDPSALGADIQTAEIDDNAITLAKLAHQTASFILLMNGSGVPIAALLANANVDANAAIDQSKLVNVVDADIDTHVSTKITGLATLTQNIAMGGYDITNLDNMAYSALTELTIATGDVTKTQFIHSIDTEADAGTDNLDHILGGTTNELVLIGPVSGARIPTVVDTASGGGQFLGAGNFTLDSNHDRYLAQYNGSDWFEISRSNNASWGWKCPHYVSCFSDDLEEYYIKEMLRNHKNIVPMIVCDKLDYKILKIKYFDGSTLIEIPKSKFGLQEHILYNSLRRISQKHLKKHQIQMKNEIITDKSDVFKEIMKLNI